MFTVMDGDCAFMNEKRTKKEEKEEKKKKKKKHQGRWIPVDANMNVMKVMMIEIDAL